MNKIINISKLIIIGMMAYYTIGCESMNEEDKSPYYLMDMANQRIVDDVLSIPASDSLSQEVIEGLILLREEEKLARDVYMVLYGVYSERIFYNIANSEERHKSAIKVLLDRYGIEDPITLDDVGIFTNETLAELFQNLVNEGSVCELNAYIVGAVIEDLDINDIMTLSESVESSDILMVYENLMKGSRNHLRSFYNKIITNGGTYDAQYISSALLDSIVSTPKERGRY